MGLRSQMATDLQAFIADADGLSVAATYTAPGEEGASVRVLMDEPRKDLLAMEDGQGEKQEMAVYVSTAELAAPVARATLAIEGQTWIVSQVDLTATPGLHKLLLKIFATTEKSSQGYRIKR